MVLNLSGHIIFVFTSSLMAFSCAIAHCFVSMIWDFVHRLRLIWVSLYSWGTGGCESKNVFGSWITPP
jgi:hypothetical protein